MRTWLLSLALALTSCGDDGGSGPPKTPPGNGGSGGGGAGATGGTSAVGGSGGSALGGSGGSSAAGSGGSSAAGSGGAPLGPGCPTGTQGEVWSKLAGTHMLEALALGGGTDAYWTVGKVYAVDVNTSDCSIVFHADSGQQVCPWTGTGWNYASETVKGVTLTIHIQDGGDQTLNTTNSCELNFSIAKNQMGTSGFFLPKSNTGAAFGPPGG